MADNQLRYGFRWKRGLHSGGQPRTFRARVASAYQATSVDLWPGDPVKMVSDGTIALCAAGDATYGIIAGIAPYYDGVKMVTNDHLPGGTTYSSVLERQSIVYIIPVAGEIFEIVSDDKTTATTEAGYNALIGENCDVSINADATAKRAYPELDISDHKTATAGWRIVDIAQRIDIDFTGLYVPLLVTCNEVQESPFNTTGV